MTKLASKLVPGFFSIEDVELGDDPRMGWIGHLVKSGIWPRQEDWSREVVGLTRDIRQAGNSLGPEGEHAKRERDKRASALKNLLRSYDPIYVLSHMAQRAMFDKGSSRDWYAVHGIHALVEYTVGLAYAGSVNHKERKDPPAAKIQEAFDLVAEIFALDWFLERYSIDRSQPLAIRHARNLLKMEKLLDRHQGYIAHLSIILKRTFVRIENEVISTLGWNPAALPEICFAVAGILQQRQDAFHPSVRRALTRAKVRGPEAFQQANRVFLKEHNEWSQTLFNVSVQELAHTLNWPQEVTSRALNDLALKPGSQPDFTLPTQDNLARLYSLLPLDDNHYFIWSPGSVVQESHAWFIDLLQKRNLDELRTKYLAARDTATEGLTIESLASIFGTNRVFGNAYYSAGGRPDVDCVVKVPRDALIVECKAHLLTASGRRGAPKRISTKLDELVTKPSRQAARFADHLYKGGAIFDCNGRKLSIPIDYESLMPRMVVTYERVDPLVSSATVLGADSNKESAWVLPLSDLLVVADLLRSPSVFWYYSVARWQQSQEQRLSVPAEGDILGLFLSSKDTFQSLTERLKTEPAVHIGPFAQEINNYYTGSHAMLGAPRKKPAITVPPLVLDSLDRMLQTDDDHWKEAVAAVMLEPNKTWAKLRSVQRKFRSVKQPRRARIMTANSSLAIWIDRKQDGSFQVDVGVNSLSGK